jgi:PAS domain S-box-containing protein
MEDLFGYAPHEVADLSTRVFYPSEAVYEQVGRDAYPLLAEGRVYHDELEMVRRDGSRFWASIHGKAIDPDHMEAGSIWIFEDISARRDMELKVRDSLREKETLLREIHHRVKNNMQVVSSLLDLQAQRLADPELKAVFLVAQRRVKAMALLHEKLYQTKDVANIDFADYLSALAQETMAAHGLGPPRTVFTTTARGIRLDLEKAVPCALAVSELLTNALKHAFPAPRAGAVEIDLVEQPGRYVLTVRDNGVGLPDGFDLARSQSLGLQLVAVLARQLGGTFQLTSRDGVTAEVAFPRSEATV